ncbi:acyltransferase [Mucilaginibacter sp. McL0603]|uniref:acyltransferase n=1 Tax=Mucilaginibacter sp. McL0603 TaxID=3415670 RepID=UPI003CF05BD9
MLFLTKLSALETSASQNTVVNKPPTIDWINNLKVISLFAVIVLHTASLLLMDYKKSPLNHWLVADFYNALVRFAVPVFVMISGTLLLHREYELGDFLKRRLTRVIWPFLFWSFVYIGYSWYNEDIAFTNDVWANIHIILHQLKYGAFYHLWYVYMLIGLYLFIPVISKFVQHATEKEILYFLLVWFVVTAFSQPYLSRFQPQIDVHYFIGYLGYLVLGHYLASKELPKGIKTPLIIYFFVCLIGITIGTYFISANNRDLSTAMYEPLGPFIILFSSGIFLLARVTVFKLPQSLVKIRDLAGGLSLGIYLCHALFLVLIDQWWGISYKLCNPVFSIPITALVCFILSFLLIFIISKIPFIGKYIAG